MTLEESTISLGDERNRLNDRLDELADGAAEADEDAVATYRQLAHEVETHLSGVVYLCEKHGADATVTIRGLTAGEFAQVEDRVAAKREQSTQQSLPGYRDNVMAASGLVDAPFLPDRDGVDDWYETKLATVADAPVGVAKWLMSRVNEETSVSEGNWKSFNERYQEKATSGD